MFKRSLIVLLLVPTLMLAIQPSRPVHGVVMTTDELAMFGALDLPDTTSAEKSKDGNGFMRALKAPFKAFGRLFGGKKKSEEGKLQRITDKDLRKFETVPARIVTDTKTTTEDRTGSSSTTTVTNSSEYSVHFNSGRGMLNAGDVNGAITELSRAVSLNSKSAEARNLLGVAYESKGMRDHALELFKSAVQADKTNVDYLNNYGFLLFKNNDFEEATKYLKRAAKLAPDNPRIWNNLGLAQCRRGKFDDAFESFTHAVGEFNGHLNIASQLLAHGYAKDAIKHLELAQKMQPNSTEVLAKLVNVYEMTGRVSDAETARRSIIALQTSADVKK
ncbi:MAG TPA: tetratricopeptide repeat protein [Pyrinomonadaceae bacterium]|jgi:Flp pilus assembly protein TadD|nr:tetratricopeptide repeat protein [Pyrinomonadaceae bacterium]